MTECTNIAELNKAKSKERRKEIVEKICAYQKNILYSGAIIRELWEISYIKSAVAHTVKHAYNFYGMCELAPVYKELSEEDLYADAFIGFEEAVSSFDTEKAKMEDENSSIMVFVAYCIPFIKSAVVCRILDESHNVYRKTTRSYQNNLVKVKKAGVLLSNTNDEIREAIKQKYSREWTDRLIDNLRKVYTVDDTFDDYHKKTTKSPEYNITKTSSDVFATLEKILHEKGATSNEMKVFHKWSNLMAEDNRAVPTKERLVIKNELSEDEMAVFKAQKSLFKKELQKYLSEFDVDMQIDTTSSRPHKYKKRKKNAVIYKFPEENADSITLVAEV